MMGFDPIQITSSFCISLCLSFLIEHFSVYKALNRVHDMCEKSVLSIFHTLKQSLYMRVVAFPLWCLWLGMHTWEGVGGDGCQGLFQFIYLFILVPSEVTGQVSHPST